MDIKRNLTLNHLIAFVYGFIILTVVLLIGKAVVNNIQLSNTIEDNNSALSPQLNKARLLAAVKLIGSETRSVVEKKSEDKKEVIKETTDVSENGNEEKKMKIEIVNTTKVVGAAKDVSEIFDADSEFELKNGEKGDVDKSVLDESILLYKNRYKSQVAKWRKDLEALGWKFAKIEEVDDSQLFDVKVVLQN